MGLLDDLTKVAGNALSGESNQPGGLVEMALNLIKNPDEGGIQGLVDKFKGIGLGDAISSWIGTGANQAISGDQLANVFGMDKIQEITGKLGVSGPRLLRSWRPWCRSSLTGLRRAATCRQASIRGWTY